MTNQKTMDHISLISPLIRKLLPYVPWLMLTVRMWPSRRPPVTHQAAVVPPRTCTLFFLSHDMAHISAQVLRDENDDADLVRR